jgi:hypothetical protein
MRMYVIHDCILMCSMHHVYVDLMLQDGMHACTVGMIDHATGISMR